MKAQRIAAVLSIAMGAGVMFDATAAEPPGVEKSPPAVAPDDPPPACPEQVAGFCCDAEGLRRCILLNPTMVGYPCLCEGPGGGWGWACS